jgi:peptidoglycan/xylan/chitin deacetylase (PgdA/CDA1 family)
MVFGNITVSVSLADSVQAHGVISLTFDDAWQNQYSNAFPLMQAKGMTGTFYVITNKLTTNAIGTTYLTFPELQTMQNSGFEIGSHSVSHSSFATLTDSQIIQECQSSKSVLQSYGLIVNNFAYSYGAYNAHTDSIVSQYYRSARDVYCLGNASTLPYSQWHVFADNGAPGDPGSLSSLKSIVDQVYSTNKWVVFYFHQILPNVINSPDVINTQTFASFLDYIQSKGVPTLTINQALNFTPTSTLTPTPSPTPIPTLIPTPASNPTGTISFSDGFENSFSSWTGTSGGVSVVSSPVYSGNYAMKAEYWGSQASKSIAVQSETYTEAQFCFDHNVAGQQTLIAYFNANGQPSVSMGISVQSGSVFVFAQTILPSYSYRQYQLTGITPGTWIKFALDASATSASIYLNGQQLTSLSQTNIPSTAKVSVGIFWGNGIYTGNLYVDNVQVSKLA